MIKPFLLRFEESLDNAAADVRCGTQTQTRQQAEGADSDASLSTYTVLSKRDPTETLVAATKTTTAVKTEGDDSDPRSCGLRAIPRCS